MEALLFHPKVVHIPMALAILMPLIAAGLLVAWWRRWLPARAWALAIVLQAGLLVSGLVALKTGEAEEDRVEQVVPDPAIEAHEHAAEAFTWAGGAVLAMMAVAGLFATRRPGLPFAALATLGTLVVLGLGYRTGQAGGRLVYQHNAGQAYATAGAGDAPRPAASVEKGKGVDDDDD